MTGVLEIILIGILKILIILFFFNIIFSIDKYKMHLPDDVLGIIKEFSMPLSRGDWKKGSYLKINFNLYECLIKQISREYKIRRLIRNFGLIYHAFFMTEIEED